MCDSCRCGCKPGKPDKGCDCQCAQCRRARESVAKSLVQLGQVVKGLPSALRPAAGGIARWGVHDSAVTGRPSVNAAKDYVASRVARHQAGRATGSLMARGMGSDNPVTQEAMRRGSRAKASAMDAFYRDGGGRGRLRSPKEVEARGWNGYRNPLKKV